MDLWEVVSNLHHFEPIYTAQSRLDVYTRDNCKYAVWWRRADVYNNYFLVAQHVLCKDQEYYKLYPNPVNIAPLNLIILYLDDYRRWILPPITFIYDGSRVVTRIGSKSYYAQAVKITRQGKIYIKRENPSLKEAVQHPVA
ncbi:MAG: hypothetical protein JHC26_11830 [Thermofilum sp.]|jgi:hypothetical protein|uniref:hypothetical protein n=1 Tax=Thermofilum sp. TaxID=1961369 RepID=UPI00258D502D|nr:hypothetical protein [Thermofilum sp.]MCI4409773.1 hypothetical protein [Thermofilum sp.]